MNTRPNSFYCDDGNTISGDGCSSTCSIEKGYRCIGATSSTKDTCSELCGDGIRIGSTGCDDGNTANKDGYFINFLTLMYIDVLLIVKLSKVISVRVGL